ncbi:hypothetical protein ACFL5O_09155 [Myxococcota bacterium]
MENLSLLSAALDVQPLTVIKLYGFRFEIEVSFSIGFIHRHRTQEIYPRLR